MKLIYASVSALALIASPALAQGNGNGNGNGGNRGGGQEHAQGHGNGNGNSGAERGNGGNENRGNGNAGNAPAARSEPARRPERVEVRGNEGRGNDSRGNEGRGNDSRGNEGRGNDNRSNDGRDYDGRGNDDRGDLDIRLDTRGLRDAYSSTRGLVEGCPPGLARRNNGCTPPGLERQQDRRYRYNQYSPDWWGYGYGDPGRYFYDDGYLLRYDGDRIAGYIPLLGGALSIGNPWPVDYGYSRLPGYYESYYGLSDRNGYRYADNVVYRMDPGTAAITSIAALLTGDEFAVGRPMPAGYDVYNVPYSYRDRYSDQSDALYRYSDGYVYQVDPETRLVAAAIELLL